MNRLNKILLFLIKISLLYFIWTLFLSIDFTKSVIFKQATTKKNLIEEKKMVKGLDISQWQGNSIKHIYRNDGIEFIICKATEGINNIDAKFAYNWKTSKQKGFIRGAYHYYQNNEDPILQAKHYIKTIEQQNEIQPLLYKDFPPILDIEEIPTDKISFQEALKKWLEHVEKKTHRVPIIYGNTYFLSTYLNDPYFSKYPLWIADWTSNKQPQLPKIWKKKGWKLWQQSNRKQIGTYKVDVDIFNGNYQQLLEFINF
jgi:lysozyme